MHLDLVADTWWRLGTLQVAIVMVNDLLGILLVDIVFGSSGSGRARVRIDASDSIIVIWWPKSIFLIDILLLQIDGTASM